MKLFKTCLEYVLFFVVVEEPTSHEQLYQACMEHAKAFTESTLEALTSCLDRINLQSTTGGRLDYTAAEEALKYVSKFDLLTLLNSQKSPSDWIEMLFDCKAVDLEINKYTESMREVQGQLPHADLRINHILVYFNCNNVPRELKQLALYDIFRMPIYSDVNARFKIVQALAHIKYNEYLLASLTTAAAPPGAPSPPTSSSSSINPLVFKNYEKWLVDYRDYRYLFFLISLPK